MRPKWLRRGREADWREELEAHQELRAEWHRERGLEAEEARAAARRDFGGWLRALEGVREVHVPAFWERLEQDCRYALRGFRRSPAFTAAAMAAIAIGIGASTAVFSVVDPLLFRPLPYPHGERLVSVGYFGPVDNNEFNVVSSYLDWRRLQTPFEFITSMRPGDQCDLQVAGAARRVFCYSVEANFVRAFGFAPALGRDFTAEDDRPGAPAVGLLSYALWRTAWGGDPGMLGHTLEVDERPVRIVGILPEGFAMPQLGQADLLLPERLDTSLPRAANASSFLRTFARLREGVTLAQARQAMLPLYEDGLRKDVPAELRSEVRLTVRSLRDRQIHEVKTASWMLLGAVLALLGLACANVANLLLARAASRRREMAMRAAIGAGRGRLMRQTLTESLLLGLGGGAAGCGLGWALVRVFVRLSPEGLLRMDEARVDVRALGFALAAALAAALLFGLAPALEEPRPEALAGRGTGESSRMFLRRLLIVMQVAVSLVLLCGASLCVRSLWKLEDQPLGFRPRQVVTASFTLRRQRYGTAGAQASFFDEMEARLRAIPGGGEFALADSIPPRGSKGRPYSNIGIVGHAPVAANGGMVAFRWVSPGYFQAMGIGIVAGRGFLESERAAGASPVIVSATLARRLFGNEPAVGRQLVLDGDGRAFPIVGVAADAKNAGVAEAAEPEYYRLRMVGSDRLGRGGVAVFRTGMEAGLLARWIRREFAAVDATLPVEIQTLEERVDQYRERPRFLAAVLAAFAAAGLLLAALGLYGLLAFLVARQTREIGVRMALGARPRDIALRVQVEAAWWIGAGIVLGGAGSVALAGTVRGLLFEVSPGDPLSLALPAVTLCGAGALAAWLPSRRAARVDPVVALRIE